MRKTPHPYPIGQSPAFASLCIAIKRERNVYLLLASLLFGGGIAFLFGMSQSPRNLAILFALLSMALIVWSFKVFYEVSKIWRARNCRLMKILHEDPAQIVWVYSMVSVQIPYGVKVSTMAILYFKLMDRSEMSLFVPHSQAKIISEALNPVLPHATFGYSLERDQWYEADPLMLRRN